MPKSPLSEEIVDRLLLLIRERSLLPGDRLPPERELAAQLQVSRPSLREALRALSIMNVVDIRQGSGTYVSSLQPELLVEHLDFVFALGDATYLQLFEARKILEVGICALAAQRITDAEADRLDSFVAESTQHVDDLERYFEYDVALHEQIDAAAGNPILSRFMSSIRRLGLVSRSRAVNRPDEIAQTIEDHRNIVRALRSHDPDAARLAMLIHLSTVERRLKERTNET